ncbi:MAG: hypothetical protein WCA93_06560 [Acidimicrobiia bacterium]
MMDIEQRVRDNLSAAANSLVVPEPEHEIATGGSRYRNSRVMVALAGALVVIAIVAIPVFLLDLGDSESAGPLTTVASTTTLATTTTSSSPDSTIGSYGLTILDTSDGDTRFVLAAERIDSEDPPTATVTLLALPDGGDEPLGEVVVGDPGGFFWNPVIDPTGICTTDISSTPEAARISFQVRLSASLGCTAPYTYEVRDGVLSAVPVSAEEVANLFMSVWSGGGEQTTMATLATPDAIQEAGALDAPSNPVLTGCEGAAGSMYCTWQDAGQDIVVRVDNVDRPPMVAEVRLGG